MVEITGGVDTHADTHTVAALDGLGRLLGHATFPADPAGYAALHAWLSDQGTVLAVGIEGTGSYGAGLARHLHQAYLDVVEVDRPDRRTRRRSGKSDPLDAIAAARAVQAGTATGNPKTRDGAVEAIRVLRVARRSAVKSRTAALNALQQLIITAPAALRDQLSGLPESELLTTCARLRPTTAATAATAATARSAQPDPLQATKSALRRLARRCQQLGEEIADADADLAAALNHTAPRLLEAFGVGPEVAGQLLVTAGDNPHRIRHDSAFAALCGVNPLPASSGRTTRHRINRGGDRAANSALYTVAIVRMRHHQPTRDYVARRIAEGRTKREIIRCLKRYIARELLPLIHNALTHPHPA